MTDPAPMVRQRMTIAEFLGFYDTRPDEEHWELVDGEAVMMTPPAIFHQLIADNVMIALRRLTGSLDRPLLAVRQIGIVLSDVEFYRPEPEVAVIDPPSSWSDRHAPRFEFVVEVFSPSDRRIMAKKIAYFQAHAPCHGIVVAHQGEFRVEVWRRSGEAWSRDVLTEADAVIETAWGPLCTLREAYAGTTLAP